jgi:putative redox protein
MSEASTVVVRSTPTNWRVNILAGGHELVADEPVELGGTDSGPDPYALLLGALGACTAMTVRMYAQRKKWPLDLVVVKLSHSASHEEDCLHCEERDVGIPSIHVRLELEGALDDEMTARLRAIAQRCPVKQTLERGIAIHLLP